MGDNSREKIMEATYQALCKHGYAELSIQKIADEFEKGKSLIYYHFDDKEDLMLSFLDHMKQQIKKDQESIKQKDPDERIDRILDMSLGIESEEKWQFQKAFQEFRAQAYHNKEFRKKLQEIDEMILEDMSDIMEDAGAEDPETAAEMLLSLLEGAISRKVSTEDREGLEQLKRDIKEVMSAFLNGKCPQRV